MSRPVEGPGERVAGPEERLFLWVRGGFYGAGAFVIGWLLTFAAFLAVGTGGEAAAVVDEWRLTTWTYFGAHGIPITDGVGSVLARGNVLSQYAIEHSQMWGLLVAPPLLIGLVARRVARGRPPGTRWPVVPITLTVGYFPLVIGTVLFSEYVPADGPSVRLHIGLAAAIAGLTYPLLFGFLGAFKGRHRSKAE